MADPAPSLSDERDTFEFLVVGGGTAGSLLASRLAERGRDVALIEWGPDDEHEPRARELRRWDEMLEGEYDMDYRCEPNLRGNSDIRLARMRILGGCSTANTMISWRPLRADLEEWVTLGATGWDPETILPLYTRLQTPIQSVAQGDRNPYVADVVESAAVALGLPVQDQWNDGRLDKSPNGAGFFEVGYTPGTNLRASTSIHYLHPARAQDGGPLVLTRVRAVRILFENRGRDEDESTPRACGLRIREADGAERDIHATGEVVLCAGAIDSPRLMQLSGLGPRDVLESACIPVVVELPGVGENLQDHVEGLVVWEAQRRPPSTCASGWDAGAVMSIDEDGEPGKGDGRPDVLMHFPVVPWTVHAKRYLEDSGAPPLPDSTLAIAPNVARPRSRGRVWVRSDSPDEPPAIDFCSFTDPDGHDEAMLLAGVRLARRIASFEPMKSWVKREVFPGPEVTEDQQLSQIARATHQTVYHPSGTCRIGESGDFSSVVDPHLRVYGVRGLRVADASVFPTLTSVNPVVTVMVVAERAADLIATDV